MSQTEIINILKDHKDVWLTTAEITNYAICSRHAVMLNIQKLKKYGLIYSKPVLRGSGFYYKYKE